MASEPRELQGSDDANAQRRTAFLEQEIDLLRAKVAESPRHMRMLEDRLAEAQSRVAALNDRNDRLAETLREARDQMVALKEEIDRLAQPASGYGVFLDAFEDGTVNIFTAGRKLRVAVSPEVPAESLQHGQEVMLNEAMNVVAAHGFERAGEVVMLKEILEGGDRALVIGHTDEERVVYLADLLRDKQLRVGESLLLETRSAYAYERIPQSEVEELILEAVPDIEYTDIGGLSRKIEAIRDAWKRMPARPGVYRMLGADGEVLYVGKAKSLKNRVAMYAQGRGHTNAIYRMIHQTVAMEIVVTATETEALLLETNMIKRLKPRYNVLMRDDKSFPFIAIRTDHPLPALQKHPGASCPVRTQLECRIAPPPDARDSKSARSRTSTLDRPGKVY